MSIEQELYYVVLYRLVTKSTALAHGCSIATSAAALNFSNVDSIQTMSEEQASDQPIVEDPAPAAEDPPKDEEPEAKPESADQEAPPSDKDDQGGAEGGDKEEAAVTTHYSRHMTEHQVSKAKLQ